MFWYKLDPLMNKGREATKPVHNNFEEFIEVVFDSESVNTNSL